MRHADQRGDDADGQLQRPHHRAGDDVGQHQERAAAREDERQQGAVQRPREGADGVGDHQPHEADDAAGGDARRGEQRRAEVDQAPACGPRPRPDDGPAPRRARAGRARRALRPIDAKRKDGVGGEHGERLPGRRAEPAEQPEEGVADRRARRESTMIALMSAPANEPTTTPESSSTRGIEPPPGDEAEPVDQCHGGERPRRRRRPARPTVPSPG